MILQYLKNAGDEGAKRDSIYEYIKDVLPQSKTQEQQLRMLGDILNAMKEDNLIKAKGRTWHERQIQLLCCIIAEIQRIRYNYSGIRRPLAIALPGCLAKPAGGRIVDALWAHCR